MLPYEKRVKITTSVSAFLGQLSSPCRPLLVLWINREEGEWLSADHTHGYQGDDVGRGNCTTEWSKIIRRSGLKEPY